MMELGPLATGPRRAALLLHAMPENDRAWILKTLSTTDRALLETLLSELRSLEIPRDSALLEQLAISPPSPEVAVKAGPADALDALTPSELAFLARVLQKEPPALGARFLRLRAWSWVDDLLKRCEPAFVSRLQAAEASLRAPAPALDTAICESILRQLASMPPPSNARRPLRDRVRLHMPWRQRGVARE